MGNLQRNTIINSKERKIGWVMCWLREMALKRCFRCLRFGHVAMIGRWNAEHANWMGISARTADMTQIAYGAKISRVWPIGTLQAAVGARNPREPLILIADEIDVNPLKSLNISRF